MEYNLSPRSAMRTGNCKTFRDVCYERNLSTYMENMEDEFRWATSKVTEMITEINTMRGSVHELVEDYDTLRERSKTLEADRKRLIAEDRARRQNETAEVKYLDDLLGHLEEMDHQIKLKPCFVSEPLGLLKNKNSQNKPK